MPSFPHRVTVVRAAVVTGPYGSAQENWAAATRTADVPANVQPIGSTEDVVAQQRTETRWRVFLPVTADVLTSDRIEWDSRTLEVVGEVERWDQGSPRSHHKLAVVRGVSGG